MPKKSKPEAGPAARRRTIASDLADFLKSGETIQQIPSGVGAYGAKEGGNSTTSASTATTSTAPTSTASSDRVDTAKEADPQPTAGQQVASPAT